MRHFRELEKLEPIRVQVTLARYATLFRDTLKENREKGEAVYLILQLFATKLYNEEEDRALTVHGFREDKHMVKGTKPKYGVIQSGDSFCVWDTAAFLEKKDQPSPTIVVGMQWIDTFYPPSHAVIKNRKNVALFLADACNRYNETERLLQEFVNWHENTGLKGDVPTTYYKAKRLLKTLDEERRR